ncbi:TPA: hypothetical protein ACGO8I_001013 [Streptococcus suis]
MMDILKSLTPDELGTVLVVLGLVRQARLWHKQILDHKIEQAKLKKVRARGESPNLLFEYTTIRQKKQCCIG